MRNVFQEEGRERSLNSSIFNCPKSIPHNKNRNFVIKYTKLNFVKRIYDTEGKKYY